MGQGKGDERGGELNAILRVHGSDVQRVSVRGLPQLVRGLTLYGQD